MSKEKKTRKEYVLLPVGGQYSLGLVVTGQPVDPALDENQAELGILVLQKKKTCYIKYELLNVHAPKYTSIIKEVIVVLLEHIYHC